jgi:hypothetical protein
MLATIPSVSIEKSKALSLTYSCPAALRKEYEKTTISESDKKILLQDKFQDFDVILSSSSSSSQTQKKTKNRVESKLSKKIFHIFTELDPETPFDEA